MNVQEYISSGIVESYVLGLADAAEKAEFERMCAAHPEVLAARDSFELLLESRLIADAIVPPQYVKTQILGEIQSENSGTATVIPLTSGDEYGGSGTRVVQGSSWKRYLTAAAVILLVGSTALNVYFFRQYQDYSARYTSLLASQQQLASSNTALEARLQSFESAISLMRDPNMQIVKMPGTNVPTSPDPTSLATVYWNTLTKDVYLLVNKMPQPASGKQYQLWALVDGKPVDAGVFDSAADNALLKMKNIPKAQAFAVTLEKTGGSVSPTMELLYVIGNVKT